MVVWVLRTFNITQYLLNQLAYIEHLLNAEQKQGEELKLSF